MMSKWGTGTAAVLITLAVAVVAGPWGSSGLDPADSSPIPGVPGDPIRGAELFRRHDCIRCHSEPRSGTDVSIPPALDVAGSRSRPEWTAAYLLGPVPLRYRSEGVRPRIRMPALRSTAADARDLAAFLATFRDTVLFPPVEDVVAEPERAELIEKGRRLFAQYQCRGCHRLAGEGGVVGPALDGVGRRRTPEYVSALLTDPQRVIPGTAMENKDLWPEEVRALTAFLMGLDAPRPSARDSIPVRAP